MLSLNNTADEGYVRDRVRYFELTYSAVGEGYIHGAMDGQVFDSDYVALYKIV